MSYSMIGLGADAPSTTFKIVNGIAKPLNAVALENFKAFQQELSRFGALHVDGDIGPATVKLYAKVTGASWTASQIASAIPVNTAALKLKAANESKPAAAPLPKPKPVQKADGTWADIALPPKPIFEKVTEFIVSPYGIFTGVGAIGLLIIMKSLKKSPARPASASTVTVP